MKRTLHSFIAIAVALSTLCTSAPSASAKMLPGYLWGSFAYDVSDIVPTLQTTLNIRRDRNRALSVLTPGQANSIVFGPYTLESLHNTQSYEVRFVASLPYRNIRGHIATIAVLEDDIVLDELVVDASDFVRTGRDETFTLLISPTKGKQYSYRISSADLSNITLERIEIWKVEQVAIEDRNTETEEGAPMESESKQVAAPEPELSEVPEPAPIQKPDAVDLPPIAIYEAEDLPRIVGEPTRDTLASMEWSVRAGAGESGTVSFGPYTTLGVGTGEMYEARFYLATEDNVAPSDIVVVDVFANEKILASQTIRANDFVRTQSYQPFSLTFRSPDGGKIEYRVQSRGIIPFLFDRVEVRERSNNRQTDWQLHTTYEGEDLPHAIGAIVDGDDASNKALRASSNESGHLTFGPYAEQFTATNTQYQARFRLKIDDNTEHNTAATIDVFNGDYTLASMAIASDRFTTPNVYQDFTLSFQSPPLGALEFRTQSLGASAVTIDRIEIWEKVAR